MYKRKKDETDRVERFARFLNVLSEHLAVTACEIADLGHIVATDRLVADRRSAARKLEVFDLLKQKCATNAALVKLAALNLRKTDDRTIEALESEIFEKTSGAVRDELLAALRPAA
jgi:hypothetical protein